MLSRQLFDVSTDTGGDFVDTGPHTEGLVLQVFYQRDTGAPLDTGCDIDLVGAITGLPIASWDNIGGASLLRSPRIDATDTGGTARSDGAHIVLNEPIRCTVTQSGNATGSKAGKIFVWTGW